MINQIKHPNRINVTTINTKGMNFPRLMVVLSAIVFIILYWVI